MNCTNFQPVGDLCLSAASHDLSPTVIVVCTHHVEVHRREQETRAGAVAAEASELLTHLDGVFHKNTPM